MGGPVTVVTGANAGIGRATAEALAARGDRTILACRNPERGQQAVGDIRERTGNDDVDTVRLDLADLNDVTRCADTIIEHYGGVKVLINNAGGMFSHRSLTPQGLEWTLCVNYLGHFLLTRLLQTSLVVNAPSCIVNVTSIGHHFVRDVRWDDLQLERRYSANQAYGQSKLAQILFTRELARRLEGTGVVVNAVHPGSVRTRLGGDGDSRGWVHALTRLISSLGVTPERAARRTVRLASARPGAPSGGYWGRTPHKPSRAARDDTAAARL
jgi:NAD(P)-dependent dehydrogenase (short-subunit alcohol dehydrogenase family)